MKLSRAHKKARRRRDAGGPVIVPGVQPTKASKAMVAALVTIAGLVGLHLTTGTAQVIVAVLQLVAVVYGVWRTYNAPKDPPAGPGVGEFL